VIRLLIVEDSPTVLELLVALIGADPMLRVEATAANGKDAVRLAAQRNVDLVLMDVHLPQMDGYDAARSIMETHPVPIIMMSASSVGLETATAFRAIEAGALTIVAKPRGVGHPDFARHSQELISSIKMMAEVKVIRRWARSSPVPDRAAVRASIRQLPPRAIEVVAIGASTGGPPVLRAILSRLPENFRAPILVVQHIATGFVHGFADWMQTHAATGVSVARGGELAMPGRVYVAPDGHQMGIDRRRRIVLIKGAPENGHSPSVSFLFRSVAEAFGRASVGILLTGMGQDGARELKLLKDAGAITIAQDEASSAVFGMPGEAVRLHAALSVLPPEAIAEYLIETLDRAPAHNASTAERQ
jgi:two-component system chemotaxis response regulator CheB